MRILAALFLLAAGCAQTPEIAAITPNPFERQSQPSQPSRSFQAAPSLQAAARVDGMGQKLLAANPQLGLKPAFRTIGIPQPEIFHQGVSEIDITEGLVNGCKTDAQLASVLSMELGRMVAQRERVAGPQIRNPEGPLPLDTRIGTDNAGSFGPADQLHRAELAKLDQQRQKQARQAAVPLDPDLLARSYLQNAGFAPHDLDEVKPLLKQAAENSKIAQQLAGPKP